VNYYYYYYYYYYSILEFQQVNGQDFEIYSLFNFHSYIILIFISFTDLNVSFGDCCRVFMFCKYCN